MFETGLILLEYSALNILKVSFSVCPVNYTYNVANLIFSVCAASYRSSFYPVDFLACALQPWTAAITLSKSSESITYSTNLLALLIVKRYFFKY